MNLPKNIQYKIVRAIELSKSAKVFEDEIREWFHKKGINVDDTNINDILIDGMTQTFDFNGTVRAIEEELKEL